MAIYDCQRVVVLPKLCNYMIVQPFVMITLGVDFKIKNVTIDDNKVKLAIWVSVNMIYILIF